MRVWMAVRYASNPDSLVWKIITPNSVRAATTEGHSELRTHVGYTQLMGDREF